MRRLFLAVAAGLFVSTELGAQALRDCVPIQIKRNAKGAWAPLQPDSIRLRLAPMVQRREWDEAVDSLVFFFTHAPADTSVLTADQKTALFGHLKQMRDEFTAAEAKPELRELGQFTERFKPTVIPGTDGYTIFNGHPPVLIVTDSMTETTRRTVCYLAWAASDLIAELRQPGLQRIADAFAKLDTTWDNFMNRGYSMTPLELWINGHFIRRAQLEPPSAQIILGHTSVATQMLMTSIKKGDRDEVLSFEPVGLLKYSGNRGGYFGASVVTTFPRNGGMGAGLMLHSSAFGHAAVLWQRGEANENRFGAALTMDLYKRLFGIADQLKQAKAEKLVECIADKAKCIAAMGK